MNKQTIPIGQEVNHLLRMKSENVRAALNDSHPDIAIAWLAELFNGNGWTAAIHKGAWHHDALLLSDPKNPDTVLLIFKFIFSTEPLSYERARQELKDFEDN